MKASIGQIQDGENIFGVTSLASVTWDEWDRHEPPVIGDYITLAFDNRDWEYRGGLYTRDLRSQEAGGYVWSFVVRTNQAGYLHLDFEWIQTVPAGWEVYVVDRDYEVVRDLKDWPQYTFGFNGSGIGRNFTLVVGPPSFARRILDYLKHKVPDLQRGQDWTTADN